MQETASLPEWKTSSGVHNGTNYQVDHPAGWDLYNLPTTAIVVCGNEPSALVSFMWIQRMGAMDPAGLLRDTLQYNGIQDYQVLYATPVQVASSPLGTCRELTHEASFTSRGERCRGSIRIHVEDAVPPLLLFSGGSIIWLQAPARKWEKYRPTLERIASGFRPGAPNG